jgi:GT2 family glycosyltransferase
MSHAASPRDRPRVKGRYLFLGEEKFFVKGVAYGPFPPNEQGEPLPPKDRVEADFRQMRAAGVNVLRVYWTPSTWFLDLAYERGLWVMIGVPWPQHICFLDQWEVKENVFKAVREAIRSVKRNPAVFCWLIGNEIPSHVARWHGAKKVETFLKRLYDLVKEEAPDVLCSYANYPSTEYLRLNFLDFLCFNVYLHEEGAFRAYVKRLQNVAGELPLVLSEFGMDSLRNGERAVATALDWQLKAAFELGVSGTVVFSWTDEWHTGGQLIEDWAFGVVDAARRPKEAYAVLSRIYSGQTPEPPPDPPLISVVVCAYNAETTLDGCLASFLKASYPCFEVLVVNDGSRDRTGAIADEYAARRPDRYRVLHQSNLGLSAARNAGLWAASGELVAYTDSDCYVDPDWLTSMAWAFQDERFAAVGGHNMAPPEDNRVAACVAVSPGAPTHVLLSDDVAEHIPGCNMAFRAEALRSIGGFDTAYRTAGDDVDACWRIMDQGGLIGFSAAMLVWHHRRNTVAAYFQQQRGYGRAEALLAPKHSARFNALGNSRWAGRIYGDISRRTLTSRPVIYQGVFGSGLFQPLYEPQTPLLAHLPLAFEWIAAALAFTALSLASPWFGALGAAMLASSVAWSVNRAAFARLPAAYDDWKSRAIIVFLTISQPVLRGWARYRTLLSMAKSFPRSSLLAQAAPLQERLFSRSWSSPHATLARKLRELAAFAVNRFTFQRYFWNHRGVERETLLRTLMDALRNLGFKPRIDSGFASSEAPPWDMEIRSRLWSIVRIRLTVEHHGGDKRFVRLAGSVVPSALVRIIFLTTALVVGAALAMGALLFAGICAAAFLALACLAIRDNFRGARMVDVVTQHMNLSAGSEEQGACRPNVELRESRP